MTITEFESLDIEARANAVGSGTYLTTRVVDDVYIQLYELSGLYVDVHYDPLLNKIILITPTLTYRPS